MGKLRPGKLLRKTNPIENPPVLKDYLDLNRYAELPEYKEYREAMRFMASNFNAQKDLAELYFKGKEDGSTLYLDTLFLNLCQAAELRQRFIANFYFRFEGVHAKFLQRFYNEFHSKIDHRNAISLTVFYQKDGYLTVNVQVVACALSLESVRVNMGTYEHLLREAGRIKEELEKFICDVPWLEKIEKLEKEIQELREKQTPSFPMGFPGVCPHRRW